MRKIVFIFVVILNATFAYGGLITTNTSNYCDNIEMAPSLSAVFEANEYTCASGYYLPANHDGCEPCPTDHTCSGGTFTFDENNSQGISYNPTITSGYNYGCDQNVIWGFHTVFEPNTHICSSGYYLPANVDECTQCPAGNYCVGGTYSFNETINQGIEPCATGYSSDAGATSCTPNTIFITWDHADSTDITANNAGSVTYGGDIRTPQKAQHINGKIFTGWTFNVPQ